MNLNEFMPTRLEDSAPIPGKSIDVQMSGEFERREKHDIYTYRPAVRYGITDEFQVDAQTTLESGGNEKKSGDIEISGLYEVLKSRTMIPTISLSPIVTFPTGKKSQELEYGARINMTSTLRGSVNIPLTEVHFNYNSAAEWQKNFYAVGISHWMFKHVAMVLDVYYEQDEFDEIKNMIELGAHIDLGDEYFLGLGAGRGISHNSPEFMSLLAFEKQM